LALNPILTSNKNKIELYYFRTKHAKKEKNKVSLITDIHQSQLKAEMSSIISQEPFKAEIKAQEEG